MQGLIEGGVEQLQITMARFHDPARLDLRVCSVVPLDDGPIVTDLRTAQIPLFSLGGVRLHNPVCVLRLAALVRAQRIDVLHSHLSTPNILAVAAGMLTRRPTVSTLHNLHSLGEQAGRMNQLAEASALRRCGQIIAVAQEVASDAQGWLGVPEDKIAVIPNAIDVSRFETPNRSQLLKLRRWLLGGRRGPLVMSVGVLDSRKGHHHLVQATPRLLERMPEARIVIVGSPGDNSVRIRDRIRSLGLDSSIACLGERRDIAELLAAADLFVLPSVMEGMPLALLEAMAAGTPVVAARVGGVPSVITNGETGMLVSPADDRELADAMAELLGAPAVAKGLAAAASRQVRKEHRAELWLERLQSLYANAVAERQLTSRP